MNPRHALLFAIAAGAWCLAGVGHASAGSLISSNSVPDVSASSAAASASGFLRRSANAGTSALPKTTQGQLGHDGSKCTGGNDAALTGACIKQGGNTSAADGQSGGSLGWQSMLPGSIQ